MLVDMNVTSLADFNYTEKTHFIDPMEPVYRSKKINDNEYIDVTTWGSGAFSFEGIKSKVEWFASLDAYRNPEEVEAALEAYYGRTTLATVVQSSPVIVPSQPATSPAAVSSSPKLSTSSLPSASTSTLTGKSGSTSVSVSSSSVSLSSKAACTSKSGSSSATAGC